MRITSFKSLIELRFLISFSNLSFIPLISLIVSIQFKLNKQLSKLNESFLSLMYSIISVNILWDDSSSIFVALKEKINPSAKLIKFLNSNLSNPLNILFSIEI